MPVEMALDGTCQRACGHHHHGPRKIQGSTTGVYLVLLPHPSAPLSCGVPRQSIDSAGPAEDSARAQQHRCPSMGSMPGPVGTARWTPVDLLRTAGEQGPGCFLLPHHSRQGGVQLQLLGFLCHHAYQEVPPASISSRADPQGLPQVGFVLFPSGQEPFRHPQLSASSSILPAPSTCPLAKGGGIGKEGPSTGKLPLFPQLHMPRPTLATEQGSKDTQILPRGRRLCCRFFTHSTEFCKGYVPSGCPFSELQPFPVEPG